MHTTAKLIRIVVVTAVVVAAGVLVLWKITENKPLLPDRAPVDVEENAVINNEAEEKMDTPSGGGGASLSYAKEITIDLAAGLATLYFENPGKSPHDAAIFIVVQDTVILQSNLLPPGSLLTSLPIPEKGVPLERGSYDAKILVQFYDEEGSPLAVNAQIEGVQIEVK